MKTENIINVVEKHRGKPGGVISILEDIQCQYRYLPREALEVVAQETGKPLLDLYAVATFYRSFSLKPKGKHLISVCLGTACHVRGGPTIAEEFEKQLDILPGETTPDKEFTFETVNCLGACALGPVAVADGHYFSKVEKRNVAEIIERTQSGLDLIKIETDQRIFPLSVSCPRCNRSLMDKTFYIDGHPSIRVTAAFNGEHGWLRLSCLYGSYSVESENPIPDEILVNLFCPNCHQELTGFANCVECGAPMLPMIVKGGGIVQICSRRGCRGHILDVA